ncbi:hypothetical protein EB796_025084 [Bugula neritina]|uniref:Uncharacterized protein n=1 Tax=Bugula neritina TaxID=10212 RepID=A0A7J7IT80_BUGNE|nr:hypothetical protein EB796_025084 [Bugula neritina]
MGRIWANIEFYQLSEWTEEEATAGEELCSSLKFLAKNTSTNNGSSGNLVYGNTVLDLKHLLPMHLTDERATTLNKMLFNFLVMCVPIHPVRVTTQQTRLNSFSNWSNSKCWWTVPVCDEC